MINKQIATITLDDLKDLVRNGIHENGALAFEQCLPGTSDADHEKFLGCVSSLANTNGGDVVFGISTDKSGKAKAIAGLGECDPKKDVLRLDSCMRDNLNPRLTAHEWKWIPIKNTYVAILRVGRSWNGPHRVTLGGASGLYVRRSNGDGQAFAITDADFSHAYVALHERWPELAEKNLQWFNSNWYKTGHRSEETIPHYYVNASCFMECVKACVARNVGVCTWAQATKYDAIKATVYLNEKRPHTITEVMDKIMALASRMP